VESGTRTRSYFLALAYYRDRMTRCRVHGRRHQRRSVAAHADVGISVVNGVDVAKNAAKIILLEKDLAVLNDGVIEARRSFANIMKYIIMGNWRNR